MKFIRFTLRGGADVYIRPEVVVALSENFGGAIVWLAGARDPLQIAETITAVGEKLGVEYR